MFITLASPCTRIPSIIFLHTWCFISFCLLHWLLLLFHFWFELHFLSSSLHLKSHEIGFLNIFASLAIDIILNKFDILNIFLFYLEHTFSRVLQLTLYLSRLTINAQQWSSLGFKSMRVGLSKHGSLFNDMHFVANNPLKLNNAMKSFLIYLNMIPY